MCIRDRDKDAMVFVWHVGGGARRSARETFTRPAGDAFHHTLELLRTSPTPQWSTAVDETCRRAASS